MKNSWIILLLMLSLSGCSGTQLSSELVDSLGLKEGTKVIADNMTVKQLGLYMMHTKVAEAYYEAMEKPTFTITPIIKKIGDTIIIAQTIEYREKPDKVTNLPEKLDIHPFWSTLSELAKYTLIGYGIHEFMASNWGAQETTTTTYEGPVQGSFNTSGNDQTIGIMRDYAPITSGGTP